MGGGFSTEGNEVNGETTNELESTPISDSDFTGDNGNGTESEFSTIDGHGFTQMGGGFSTEGNEANEGNEEGTANKRSSALMFWGAGEDANSHKFALIGSSMGVAAGAIWGGAL